MVLSIGTDIVDVKRVEKAIKRRGERFGRKILCPDELAEWQKRKCSPAFLAKRFAAKEAIAKALGTGIDIQEHVLIQRGGRMDIHSQKSSWKNGIGKNIFPLNQRTNGI